MVIHVVSYTRPTAHRTCGRYWSYCCLNLAACFRRALLWGFYSSSPMLHALRVVGCGVKHCNFQQATRILHHRFAPGLTTMFRNINRCMTYLHHIFWTVILCSVSREKCVDAIFRYHGSLLWSVASPSLYTTFPLCMTTWYLKISSFYDMTSTSSNSLICQIP